ALDIRGAGELTGYEAAQRLLQMADSHSQFFDPFCGEVLQSAAVEDVYGLRVSLRRATPAPLAVLAAAEAKTASPQQAAWPGRFQEAPPIDGGRRFLRTQPETSNDSPPPQEIVEFELLDSYAVLDALRSGRIDVVERVAPAELAALKTDSRVVVGQYALPRIHLLAPNPRQPLSASATFRRAVASAIDRANILKDVFTPAQRAAGTQVVSGPFPVARNPSDVWGYAADSAVEPLPYEPAIGLTLLRVAEDELARGAIAAGRASPKLETLVIGHGSDPLHTQLCRVMTEQLTAIGVAARHETIADDDAAARDACHFWYVELAMREPAVDALQLFSPDGLALPDDHLALALRGLQGATGWQQARDALYRIHAIVHSRQTVIPLWQTVDNFAVRKGIRGAGADAVSLYDGLDQWRPALPASTVDAKEAP
ncbi:MAG: hypothetical protein KDA41_21320, partial [Planctomycetales bacterium]|nr:hypothetical protein [Planctomycetales bacterium]